MNGNAFYSSVWLTRKFYITLAGLAFAIVLLPELFSVSKWHLSGLFFILPGMLLVFYLAYTSYRSEPVLRLSAERLVFWGFRPHCFFPLWTKVDIDIECVQKLYLGKHGRVFPLESGKPYGDLSLGHSQSTEYLWLYYREGNTVKELFYPQPSALQIERVDLVLALRKYLGSKFSV